MVFLLKYLYSFSSAKIEPGVLSSPYMRVAPRVLASLLADLKANMVNLRVFASLTYLTQYAFLGGYTQSDESRLHNVIPKREVLYVGGQYTNITVTILSPGLAILYRHLRMQSRTMLPVPHQRPS